MAITRRKLIISTLVLLFFILSAAILIAAGKVGILPLWGGNTQINPSENDSIFFKNNTPVAIIINDPLLQKQFEEEQRPLFTIDSWKSGKPVVQQEQIPPQPKQPKAGAPIEVSYPLKARRLGWEGITSLDVSISPTGKINEIIIVSGSGYKLLDEAAIKAIKATKFLPGSSTQPMNLTCSVEFILK